MTFDLPNPRPNGNMVVSVVVFDLAGQPIDAVRRRVRIGRIAEGTRAATERPTGGTTMLGKDGLMGGIVFAGS